MRYRGDGSSGSSKYVTEALLEVVERRRAERVAFITEALVAEVSSGAHLAGRSCDLVEGGCYVDTINPFPEGATVRIRLQHGNSRVEALGRVVYAVVGMGMGLAFEEISDENQAKLDEWLSLAQDGTEVNDALRQLGKIDKPATSSFGESHFTQLIELLREKGILTKAEEARLLKKPSDSLI